MPDDKRAIIQVPFHNDTLYAQQDGEVTRVAIKEISDRLGLAWQGQLERIKRNPILADGIRITLIPSLRGGIQETTTLPLDLLNGWLFGIQASRVKPELRETILTYQRECYEVLHRHFFASRDDVKPRMSPEQVREMIREEVAEAVRLMKGAVWGMTKGQTAHIDLGLTEIGCAVYDTKDAVDKSQGLTIRQVRAALNIDPCHATKIASALRIWCATNGWAQWPRTAAEPAYKFPPGAVQGWWRTEGCALVKARTEQTKAEEKRRAFAEKTAKRDADAGQGVLPFKPKPAC